MSPKNTTANTMSPKSTAASTMPVPTPAVFHPKDAVFLKLRNIIKDASGPYGRFVGINRGLLPVDNPYASAISKVGGYYTLPALVHSRETLRFLGLNDDFGDECWRAWLALNVEQRNTPPGTFPAFLGVVLARMLNRNMREWNVEVPPAKCMRHHPSGLAFPVGESSDASPQLQSQQQQVGGGVALQCLDLNRADSLGKPLMSLTPESDAHVTSLPGQDTFASPSPYNPFRGDYFASNSLITPPQDFFGNNMGQDLPGLGLQDNTFAPSSSMPPQQSFSNGNMEQGFPGPVMQDATLLDYNFDPSTFECCENISFTPEVMEYIGRATAPAAGGTFAPLDDVTTIAYQANIAAYSSPKNSSMSSASGSGDSASIMAPLNENGRAFSRGNLPTLTPDFLKHVASDKAGELDFNQHILATLDTEATKTGSPSSLNSKKRKRTDSPPPRPPPLDPVALNLAAAYDCVNIPLFSYTPTTNDPTPTSQQAGRYLAVTQRLFGLNDEAAWFAYNVVANRTLQQQMGLLTQEQNHKTVLTVHELFRVLLVPRYRLLMQMVRLSEWRAQESWPSLDGVTLPRCVEAELLSNSDKDGEEKEGNDAKDDDEAEDSDDSDGREIKACKAVARAESLRTRMLALWADYNTVLDDAVSKLNAHPSEAGQMPNLVRRYADVPLTWVPAPVKKFVEGTKTKVEIPDYMKVSGSLGKWAYPHKYLLEAHWEGIPLGQLCDEAQA